MAPEIRTGAVSAFAETFTLSLNTLVPVVDRVISPEHLRLFGVRDGEVTGIVDFVEETHTHLMIGGAQVAVTGTTPFPTPVSAGLSLHVEPGYGLTFAPVRTPQDRRDR